MKNQEYAGIYAEILAQTPAYSFIQMNAAPRMGRR
jgi:hypothetical protein